ncbi:Uncharacterised protein [Mycobacteroides abscessus subsp. abscessus]|nr:Uncharacterised protein [Mycobacteroides abscessus subsp. abscessus]
MQTHEFRILDVVLRDTGIDLLIHRIGRPLLARRPRLRKLGEPHLESLVLGVGGEQSMQSSGPGAG